MERLKDNSINDIGRQPDGMPAVLLIGMLKYGTFAAVLLIYKNSANLEKYYRALLC